MNYTLESSEKFAVPYKRLKIKIKLSESKILSTCKRFSKYINMGQTIVLLFYFCGNVLP